MLMPGKKYKPRANSRAAKAVLSGIINTTGVTRFNGSVSVNAFNTDELTTKTNATYNATTDTYSGQSMTLIPPTISKSGVKRITVAALDDTTGKLQARASLDGGVTWTPRKVMRDQGLSGVGSADLCVGGTATASSYNTGPNPDWTPASAFNDSLASPQWQTNAGDVVDAWLAYEFAGGASHCVKEYSLTVNPSAYALPGFEPTEWYFQGYNGSSWIEIDHRIYSWGSAYDHKETFQCHENTTAYTKYRWLFKSVTSQTRVVISEAEMFLRFNAHTIDLDVSSMSGSAPVYEITTDNADHAIRGAAMILE